MTNRAVSVNEGAVLTSDREIQSRIMTMRGIQVMLDRDLAALFGVETKALNQAVKRNTERFPVGFMYHLTDEEWQSLRSQIVTSKVDGISEDDGLRSQTVTSKRGGVRYRPYVFTEHGVVMLASVLKSEAAVQASIRVVNVFVAMRRALASMAPLLTRIEAAERRQIVDQSRNEERFSRLFEALDDKRFPTQKVFYDGEFFDAFEQMKRFVRKARKELIVIDPYFDDSCLPLLAQKQTGVMVTVVVCARGHRNLHDVDVTQFNKQYANSLLIKESEKFHDRYMIIDQTMLIHIGASLNYLGKKCFAFSTLEAANIPDIMARLS